MKKQSILRKLDRARRRFVFRPPTRRRDLPISPTSTITNKIQRYRTHQCTLCTMHQRESTTNEKERELSYVHDFHQVKVSVLPPFVYYPWRHAASNSSGRKTTNNFHFKILYCTVRTLGVKRWVKPSVIPCKLIPYEKKIQNVTSHRFDNKSINTVS